MARKIKLTAFSRLLILLIFVVPTIYIGASYYNNEDGIQNIKDLIGLEDNTPSAPPTTKVVPQKSTKPSNNTTQSNQDDLEKRIELLEKKIKTLEAELQRLKR